MEPPLGKSAQIGGPGFCRFQGGRSLRRKRERKTTCAAPGCNWHRDSAPPTRYLRLRPPGRPGASGAADRFENNRIRPLTLVRLNCFQDLRALRNGVVIRIDSLDVPGPIGGPSARQTSPFDLVSLSSVVSETKKRNFFMAVRRPFA